MERPKQTNPRVFMEVQIGSRHAGKIEFELFADFTPRTAENFRALCTGERGSSPVTGSRLHFKGCTFHRIIRGFMAQGGDFTQHDGTGGESIYGEKFPDENFMRLHSEPGLLSMANSGPDTNGSQFFITFKATPHLDDRHVVFGKVTSGMDVVRMMEMVATDMDDKPRMPVIISECGEIGEVVKEPSVAEKAMAAYKQKSEQQQKKKLEVSHKDKAQSQVEEEEKEEQEEQEEEISEDVLNAMSEKQRRLFNLRMKMNKSRKMNKKAVEEEHHRLTDPNYKKKERQKERQEAKKRWEEELKEKGLDKSQACLLETAEQASGRYLAKKKKEKKAASFGWDVFNQDSLNKAYKNRLQHLPKSNNSTKDDLDNPCNYGAIDRPSEDALEHMASELRDRDEKRKKFSRRRQEYSGADVDYINDRNKHFNKKIKRAFDKYTVEIRQNLERGTAL